MRKQRGQSRLNENFKYRSARNFKKFTCTPAKANGKNSFHMTDIKPVAEQREKGNRVVFAEFHIGGVMKPFLIHQQLPQSVVQHNITIERSRRGKFFLHYCMEKNPKMLSMLAPPEHRNVIALDPGVRVFQTRFNMQDGSHFPVWGWSCWVRENSQSGCPLERTDGENKTAECPP